jgi:putative FmdB family regulatory protein
MPIYEYACEQCGEKFEQLVRSMSGEAKIACPKCASSKTKRALSVFAVGAESGKSAGAAAPGMCGRCGGPGPCAAGE